MQGKLSSFNQSVAAFFKVYDNRGYNNVKNFFLKDFNLNYHERIAALSKGKYLLQTDDITLLDIHVAPFWETLYLLNKGPMKEDLEPLNLETKAPNLIKYIEMFREHPRIKPHRLDAQVLANYWARAKLSGLSYDTIHFSTSDYAGIVTD